MFSILSPAKTQNFDAISSKYQHTLPDSLKLTSTLHQALKCYQPNELKSLMSISDKLAELNYQRFQNFNAKEFNNTNSKPALFTFHGDVYRGIDANHLSNAEIKFAQQHIGIISGFYGLLRPLDLIQAYRLEMKTKLPTKNVNNLYEFWKDTITDLINQRLKEHKEKTLINLASNEYFKAINPKNLNANIITIDFKEKKNNTLKTIGIHAKYARGLMTRYIIQNKINHPKALQQFNQDRYKFNKNISTDTLFVFVR